MARERTSLTQAQAVAVYRAAFPNDKSSILPSEARQIKAEMNRVANAKNDELARSALFAVGYIMSDGDSFDKAAKRIRSLARSLNGTKGVSAIADKDARHRPHMPVDISEGYILVSSLRAERVKRGLTQTALAKMIKRSSSVISAAERGVAPMQPYTVATICSIFRCEPTSIMGYRRVNIGGEEGENIRPATSTREAA